MFFQTCAKLAFCLTQIYFLAITSWYTEYIKKNFILWSLNYLQAIVLIWQLWLLRINDPQKQKVLYTLEINNNVI